ncbi:MAG TPA: ankyrin repeat domain-containing protein [Thermoanaerobaculia bacterium]|jgi:ankyrin repeat protein|nr:ankyrin repeat domain-containing protein [Thermoanaerobaculia bacterium]
MKTTPLALVALAALLLAVPPVQADQAASRAQLEKDGLAFTSESFFQTIAKGDAAHAVLFVEAGIDPSAQNGTHRTALWIATERRQLEVLKALLGAGVVPNEKNAPPVESGKSIVFEAVDTGEAPYVRALVEAGADAKMANEYGVPPLAEAARTGQLEMCQILLQGGADPNAAPGGFPLLYGPINEKHLDVVKLLLASGAKLGEHKAELIEAATDPEIRAALEAAE